MKQKYKLLLIILIFIILSALGFVCGKRYLYKPVLSKNVILFSEKEKNIKTSPLHIITVNTKLNIQESQLQYGNLMIQVPQNITIQQQPKDKDALALDLCGAEIIKDDDGEEKCAEFPPRIWLQHYHIDAKEYNADYHHYAIISALLDLLEESFDIDVHLAFFNCFEEIDLLQRALNEYFFIFTLPYQTGYIFVQGVDVYIIREMTLESEYSFGALVDNQAVMWKNTSNIILKEDNNQDRTAYQKITIDDDNSFVVQKIGNQTNLIKDGFYHTIFLRWNHRIYCEDFNFDGYPDIVIEYQFVFLWDKEQEKWKYWQPPKDFPEKKNSKCIPETKTIWTFNTDYFLGYEQVDILWKWEKNTLKKMRECRIVQDKNKITISAYQKNMQSAWIENTFSTEEWMQNIEKKAVFYQQFFKEMVPEEVYGKTRTLSNNPKYIPQELMDKMADALFDNTVYETCNSMKNELELEKENVLVFAKDNITLRNMILEMKWRYVMRMSDGDNDGILDIVSAEPNGGSNGCTYYVFYKGQKDAAFEKTSSYQKARESFWIIQFEGKNYLCRILFDYTTKMDNGISLAYYIDGKWAEEIKIERFAIDYEMKLAKCSDQINQSYIVQIMENAQKYKNKIDLQSYIDGSSEIHNDKMEYQCDLDNDGILEQYKKSVWEPINMNSAQHVVLEGEGESLDYIREVLNSVEGIPNMMWVEQNNGENIINVISRTDTDDFVITGFAVHGKTNEVKYCINGNAVYDIEQTRQCGYYTKYFSD